MNWKNTRSGCVLVETRAVAWWLAGKRKASGLPWAAEVGLALGAS
jgi:hypothetical protein